MAERIAGFLSLYEHCCQLSSLDPATSNLPFKVAPSRFSVCALTSLCRFLCDSITQYSSALSNCSRDRLLAFPKLGEGALKTACTLAVTLISLLYDENLEISSKGASSVLKTSTSIAVLMTICSGKVAVVVVCLIGHSLSFLRRNFGPDCHSFIRSTALAPLDIISAILSSPSTQYHSFFAVFSWISPTLTATKVLKPYESFCVMALTISESTIRYVFTKLYLISLWINSFILAESRAALSSNRTVVIFFRGANLDFAMISLLSNEPSIICHRAYAHAPNAFSEASLKIINVGSPTEFSGMMDRLKRTDSISNNSRKKSIHASCSSAGIGSSQSSFNAFRFRSNILAQTVRGVAKPRGS